MSLPWFRVYRELKDDPKVGTLDDASFRVFIESLCWACEKGNGGGTGLTVETSEWAFRRNVTQSLQSLFQKQLLAVSETGEIVVPKWSERQKMSDSSAERVRKYRVKHGVTLQKRSSNAIEENRIEENRIDKTPPVAPKGSGVPAFSLLQLPEKIRTQKFKDAFDAWIKNRMASKKVKDWNALFAAQLAWMDKQGYSEERALEIISASVRNGWTGLFHPRPDGATASALQSNGRQKMQPRPEPELKAKVVTFPQHTTA